MAFLLLAPQVRAGDFQTLARELPDGHFQLVTAIDVVEVAVQPLEDEERESALRRIEDGEYGYCEKTGEPISLKRLIARPIATMTLEAQERHERREKVHRDD